MVAIVIGFTLLPVIKVNLSVQGSGIIGPVTEKTEVKSLILQLRTDNIKSKLQFLLYQQKETFDYVSD
jgi:hypothetical protein